MTENLIVSLFKLVDEVMKVKMEVDDKLEDACFSGCNI